MITRKFEIMIEEPNSVTLAPAPKRTKKDREIKEPPSSIICSFVSQEGNTTGPPIDLPVISNSKQLELLVNSLLQNEEAVMIFIQL